MFLIKEKSVELDNTNDVTETLGESYIIFYINIKSNDKI